VKEIWKTIEDFPDYEVSNLGRVKSFKKYKEGKILKPQKNNGGYLYVNLWKDGKQYTKTIHRLVLEAFNPVENMDRFECNHKNGLKLYNIYPNNLEWVTRSENQKHAYKIGLKKGLKGENHPMFGKYGENHPMFGKHHTEGTKKKQSEKKKGKNNPMFGKCHSEETRKKQSERLKGENHYLFGKHPSEETRKKLSEINKGENNPNYGKHPSEETRKKQSEKARGKYKGENNPSVILTEKDVIEIKMDLKEGKSTQRKIAEKFGIHESTISKIKLNKIWSHIRIKDEK